MKEKNGNTDKGLQIWYQTQHAAYDNPTFCQDTSLLLSKMC